MLRIASLLTTGLLVAAVALAQEEPPPPVEGWTQTSFVYNITDTPQFRLHTVWAINGPGYYTYQASTNFIHKVIEVSLQNSNPDPGTSPVLHGSFSELVDTENLFYYSGSEFLGPDDLGYYVVTTLTEADGNQEFRYNPWVYMRRRTLELRWPGNSHWTVIIPRQ